MALDDLKARIRQILIDRGCFTDSEIDEIVDYLMDHLSVDENGYYIIEGEPE